MAFIAWACLIRSSARASVSRSAAPARNESVTAAIERSTFPNVRSVSRWRSKPALRSRTRLTARCRAVCTTLGLSAPVGLSRTARRQARSTAASSSVRALRVESLREVALGDGEEVLA